MRIYKRIIILVVALALTVVFTASNHVFAAQGNVTKIPSNPNGNVGWYKSVSFKTSLTCSGGGVEITVNSTYKPPEGGNDLKFFIKSNAIYIKVNNYPPEKMESSCGSGPFIAPSNNETPDYSWNTKLESKIEAITITSPKNNSNTNKNEVTVSGKVIAVSGIKAVTVNNKKATVNGSSWTTDLTLVEGLNNITASIESVAGNTLSTSINYYYHPSLSLGPEGETQETGSELNNENSDGDSKENDENPAEEQETDALEEASATNESTQSGGLVKNTFFNNKILTTLFILVILSSAGVLAFKTEVVSRFIKNKFLKR